MVTLAELLKQNTKNEIVEPDKLYRALGVRLEGKGPFIREIKLGSQIRAKKLQRVSSGDFIYSRLFAWRGALASIPVDMDGAYVSNEFPNFKIDQSKLHLKFLEFYFKQRWVWNEIEKHCTGTTKASRNRFKVKFFLDFEIPLPSLVEQKRIVARIERLLVRIEKARRLRARAIEDVEAMVSSTTSQIFKKVAVVFEQKSLEALISMTSGKGLPFSQMSDEMPYRVYGGGGLVGNYDQFLVEDSKIVIGRVGARCGCVFVTEPKSWITDNALYLTYISEHLDRDYLVHALRNLDLRQQAKEAAQPVVSQKRIKSQSIPLPPLPVQRRIVAFLDSLREKVDELKKLQNETEKEIEELIPNILDKAFKGEL